jgi:uncharacterized protein YndB with AHSA1/START domain
VAEKGKQVFKVVIDGPQEAIWREITSTDRPLGAIFNSRMHTTGMRPGARMQMRTASGGHVIVDGDILEFSPPHRFVHTHKFTMHDDPVCRVTYELKPVAGGIEVTLTVDDVPLGTRTAKGMASGGHDIVNNLKAIVERGRAPPGQRIVHALMGALEFVLPSKTKADRWPLEERRTA